MNRDARPTNQLFVARLMPQEGPGWRLRLLYATMVLASWWPDDLPPAEVPPNVDQTQVYLLMRKLFERILLAMHNAIPDLERLYRTMILCSIVLPGSSAAARPESALTNGPTAGSEQPDTAALDSLLGDITTQLVMIERGLEPMRTRTDVQHVILACENLGRIMRHLLLSNDVCDDQMADRQTAPA